MEAELLEHKIILDNFKSEYTDDYDTTEFIAWITDGEEKTLKKFKALFYLITHYCHFEGQNEILKKKYYHHLRVALQKCVKDGDISVEIFKYYNEKIKSIDKCILSYEDRKKMTFF